MTVYLAETFDTITVGAVTPSGWSEGVDPIPTSGSQYWAGANAPAYMYGRVASAVQNAVAKYLTRTFSAAAGNGARIRLRHATTNATSTRAGHYKFYNGTTNVGFSILFHTDGKIYITNMATAATQVGTYTTGTLYDITIVIGASGAISSVTVNGSTTTSPGTMNNSLTSVDRVYVDAYNGGSGSGTIYFDGLIADNATAVPAGSLASSGTLDGVTLGCTKYGTVILGYTASGGAPSVWRIERSADNGTTWADVTQYMLVTATASGYTIHDRRPQQGSQAVTLGSNVKYRVTAMNATGDQSALTTAAIATALDTATIKTTRASLLHTIMGGSTIASDSTHGLSGEKYSSNWVLAMAYAYFATGTAGYKTDAIAQFNYIKASIVNSDFLSVVPDDNTVIYRDHHMRQIYYCALAAKLMRLAGDPTTAASWITEVDKWAKAFFDKLNSGNPAPTSVTNYGWDPNNTRTGTQNAAWQAGHAYSVGAIVKPTSNNSRTYRCVTAGTSHATTEPVWTTTAGATQPTDGTVVWECIGATGHVTFSTYTNNGTTYTGVAGTDVGDLNQLSEEAAAWALLTVDTDSAFSSAGTYKTKAETRVTEIMGLLQTYQVTRGAVPLGEALSGIPYNGNEQYDTVYGGFTVTTAAVVYSQRPDLCHARTLTWIDRILDWFDTSYNGTEPLQTNQYAGGTTIGLPEVEFPDAGYRIRGRTNPRNNLWNQGCLIDPSSDKWRWYDQYGAVTNSPTIGDNVQARLFNGLAIAESVLNLVDPAGRGSFTAAGRNATDKITDSATRGSAAFTGRSAPDATSGNDNANRGSATFTGRAATGKTTDSATRGSAAFAGRAAAETLGGVTDTATRGAFTANGRGAVDRTPGAALRRPFFAPLDIGAVTAPLDVAAVTAPLDMDVEV